MYTTFFKRFFDIALSFLAILFLSWLFMLIALAITIDDPGPVFFKQKRVGKNKKLFAILNVVSTKPNLIKRGLGAELRHGCTEMAA